MFKLGIVASSHSQIELAFNTRTYDELLTTSSTSANTTSLTAGSEGDLAVLIDYRINNAATNRPPFFNPTGWNFELGGILNADTEHRFMITSKVLTAAEAASGSVTTGEGENSYTTILFFTPNKTISNRVDFDRHFEGTLGDALLQVQNVTTAGASAPALILGFKSTVGGTTATFTTPTWDATFLETIQASEHNLGRLDFRIGYIIQNTTLADVNVDANDEGAEQILASVHLGVV